MNTTCNHAPLLVKHLINLTLTIVHSRMCYNFCTYSLAIEIKMSLHQYFHVNNQPANTQLSPTQRALASHSD